MTDKIVKNLIIYGLVFIYPVTTILFNNISFGGLILDEFRLVTIFISIAYLFSGMKKRFRFGHVSRILLPYYLYVNFRAITSSNFSRSQFMTHFFLLILIIVIENINWNKKDETKLILTIQKLLIAIVIVGLYQFIFNSTFYYFGQTDRMFYSYGNQFRIRSLFTGLALGEGWTYTAILTVYILFSKINFNSIYKQWVLILGCVATLLTQTRSVWLILIAGYFFYFINKFKISSKTIAYIYISVIILFIILQILIPSLLNSLFYEERFMDRSVNARFDSWTIFVNHLLPRTNIIYGTGNFNSNIDINRFGRNSIISVPINVFLMGGLIGLILYYSIWISIYKIGIMIYNKTKNHFIKYITIILILYGFNIGAYQFNGIWFIIIIIIMNIQYSSYLISNRSTQNSINYNSQ